MASDDIPDLQELFATATRNKPLRTYSHKGRNSRAVSLPALKPTLDAPTPANSGARLQRFRIGHANSWEVKPLLSVPTQELPIVRAEHADGIGHDFTDETDGRAQEGPGKMESPSTADLGEHVTSPASPRHSEASCDSETSEDPKNEDKDDDDDDDLIVLSQRPLGTNYKHDRRTGNGTRSLRRRPFLIFDKTETKGYKQLKNKPQVAETSPALRYKPGDGFSGREAKPNGSKLLTRSGKQYITSPHVGILDLTQSEQRPEKRKRKRTARKVNFEDNSFATSPKKKARRPLVPKDSNLPRCSATAALVKVESSSSTPAAARTNTMSIAPTAQKSETRHTTDNQDRKIVPEDRRPHSTIAQETTSGGDDEVDMLIVEGSDEIHDNAPTISQPHGVLEEGQDSCGTHVSVTPPHKLRSRARSASPKLPPRQDAAGSESRPPLERVLRRFNTQ